MHPTDEELIEDILLGTDGAFEKLVHRYTTPIYNFAYRLVGNTEQAKDITQETFIKVWKNIEKYNSSYPFKAWIFTIARNTSTDFLRKKKSVLFSSIDSPYDKDTSFESTIADENTVLPSEALMKLEDEKYLNEVLDKLPLDYKTVLLLHYQDDMTFEEIGHIMGKPLNTVKSWHRRTIIKLREMLS